MSKKKLGQFYTTNFEYILSDMKQPKVEKIVEPFVGKGDLLNFLKNIQEYKIEAYDIDTQNGEFKDFIVENRDTLMNPPDYTDKYIITNPPYLARNKYKGDKKIFDKYDTDDLYKCFIKEISGNNSPMGGIFIIPLNFFCSIRKNDILLRKNFLSLFKIERLNIFNEKVFMDTGYTICSFQFSRGKSTKIDTVIYPESKNIKIILNKQNNYTIGGELYKLPINNNISIERTTRINSDNKYITNIVLSCIDSSEKIKLFKVENREKYIDSTKNLSFRTFALLIVKPKIIDENILIEKFNNYITKKREKYDSLFLTNYRENGRKRISFGLAFNIINYIIDKYELVEF